MKLAELHDTILSEATLQQIIKQLLKSAETLSDVLGKNASLGAKLLGAKTGDNALTLHGNTPKNATILKSLAHTPGIQADETQGTGMKLIRMPGGAKLLIVGSGEKAVAVTTDHNKSQLVEAKDDPCWKGYEQVGTKKKKGKTVPNCVPKKVNEEKVEKHPYSVKVLSKGKDKHWPTLKGEIYENDVMIGTFSRGAVTDHFVPPIEYKFRSSGAKARFDDFADSLSIEETIEALLPRNHS